ncbi:MAG TPA: amidohydrolase family protein [Sedimentisphaerales bacterium]|nr:amidohydrolase family protein [Sedimentisphaerales bacterium]
MPRIVDFHTHAFPDSLAARAIKTLLDEAPGIRAYLDGTTGDLLRSMDRIGIEKSVVCCIATRPEQFGPILKWCGQIRSDRLIPLPSVHPADPVRADHIRCVADEGFLGIKLHPYYQDFFADEDRMMPLYAQVADLNLLLVMHTGYDIAFPRIRRADPAKIVLIKERFPALRFIATHLGAWQQWDEVREYLIGRQIHIEVSFASDDLEPEKARAMILSHPAGYMLFGTDSPWTDQGRTLEWLEGLRLPPDVMTGVLGGNALRLLRLSRDEFIKDI